MIKKKYFLLVFFIFSFIISPQAWAENIKNPEFAGSFYPQDKEELKKQITEFSKNTNVSWDKDKGEILGVVVPHAGYIYSGPIAACSYVILPEKKIDTVIILGASHKYPLHGVAIYPSGQFLTPLGNLTVDQDTAKKFSDLPFVCYEQNYFYKEHSLEVQLPFILQSLGQVKIVPVIFGMLDYNDINAFAKKLADIVKDKNILVIVSSDLSHYKPYADAVMTDKKTLDLLEKKDTQGLWESVKKDEGRACGIIPLITLLLYAKDIEADVEILKYLNSGDTAGDKSKVVGYVSAVIYKKNNKKNVVANNNIKGGEMNKFVLNQEEKKILLKIARDTLTGYLKDKKIPKFNIESANLREKRGAFVTLTKNGMLRGCIGRIVGDTPLHQVIVDFAIEAGLHDPRFSPVTFEELKDIQIEISVLTPFEEVKNIEEIEVGKHGLMIRKGWSSGLLLPQVASEYGWDRDTFLKETCHKAGLDSLAYKDKDAIIYKFSAIVFNEAELFKE